MRELLSLCVAALAALGLASPASAYSFSPKNSAISGDGVVSFVEGSSRLSCAATFSGSSNSAGVIKISKITFRFCDAPTPLGLPWTLQAMSASKATIDDIGFSKVFGGVCGAGDLPVTVSPSHVSGFAFDAVLKGKCRLEGTFSVKQFLQIVK